MMDELGLGGSGVRPGVSASGCDSPNSDAAAEVSDFSIPFNALHSASILTQSTHVRILSCFRSFAFSVLICFEKSPR